MDVLSPTRYPELPTRTRADGTPRRVGVELEFAGLDEQETSSLVGELAGVAPVRDSERGWRVPGTPFGDCHIYLDTAFEDDIRSVSGEIGLGLARKIVPVELVTDPLDPVRLPEFDRLVDRLRKAGATGTRDGLLLGFGVHLNVETATEDMSSVVPTVRSYALLEEVIRAHIDLDLSRRVLPFTAPYPDDLVDDLAYGEPRIGTRMDQLYLSHTTSRSHGLDLLPVLASHAPDRVKSEIEPDTKLSPRWAYHYRLPDCRIDEADWGLEGDWRRWVAVEKVAADRGLIAALCRARVNWAALPRLSRPGWKESAAEVLRASDDGDIRWLAHASA